MTERLASILTALVVALGAAPALAVAPELLSYQGVLVQNNGVAVPNGVYNLRFRLFDHATAGTKVFEQTLSAQVTSGLYNVVLSNNNGYDLGDVVAQNTQLFMEVTVLAAPPAVPAAVILLPRQQLASVPFALTGISPTPPGIVGAQMLRFTTETPFTANAWTAPSGLSGLTLAVPASTCVVEVRAEVVLGSDGGTDSVGVRLEQSFNGGAYATVRGPVVVTVPQDGDGAELSYIVSGPSTGTYVYRVALREENDGDFELNPVVGVLGTSESTLAYEFWCP